MFQLQFSYVNTSEKKTFEFRIRIYNLDLVDLTIIFLFKSVLCANLRGSCFYWKHMSKVANLNSFCTTLILNLRDFSKVYTGPSNNQNTCLRFNGASF